MRQGLNIIGSRFGYFIVQEILETTAKNGRFVLCQCDCGAMKKVRLKSIKNGGTKSCGCLNKRLIVERLLVHGLSKHPLHKVWDSMIDRCTRPKCNQYKDYGGRGITVCKEWMDSFMSFYNWAILNGWQSGLQLDKDKKGNGFVYGPESCCFLTPKDNCRKKRNNHVIEYNGVKKCIAEWCEIYSTPYFLTRQRIVRDGWDFEKAFNIN